MEPGSPGCVGGTCGRGQEARPDARKATRFATYCAGGTCGRGQEARPDARKATRFATYCAGGTCGRGQEARPDARKATRFAISPLAPPFPEGLARHWAQIAHQGPAGKGPREVLDLPAAHERPLADPAQALGALVVAAARERLCERAHGETLRVKTLVALGVDHPTAQMHQHTWDVDLHRTDLVAGAAEARGPRQRAALAQLLELRREDCPDRSRIDRLVGMAARARVDRADVQAGAAADAAQRLAPVRIGERGRAPVVEQHEVELTRAVALANARPERRVRVHSLARGRARKELQEHL